MQYIFDFDGTIVDSQNCMVVAIKKTFKQCGLAEPTDQDIDPYIGLPVERFFKVMVKQYQNENQYDLLLQTFRKIYRQLEEATMVLYDDMRDVLAELSRSNKLFIVSSKKTAILRRNLIFLKIEDYFEDYIGSDQLKEFKPHPEGVLKLISRHHLEAKDCVVIGDTTFDIQMGQAAGCETCAITWGSHTKAQLKEENPTYIIRKVRELLTIK